MNNAPAIFLGVFLVFASAWLGLIFAPYAQLSGLAPVVPAEGGDAYPRPLGGLAAQGRVIYRVNGCIYCHSQQIRSERFGTDIARGWGPRRTVARDYIYDSPHLLGSMRTGPDLANIGARQPSAQWHHRHLFNPTWTSPGSIMSPFSFLYESRKIVGQKSVDALPIPKGYPLADGYEIVPSDHAKALVAYLQALDHTTPLPEAEEQ